MALLIEDAEPRGLPIAGIELGGRALRRGDLSGLNLREGQIEFGAVADAAFDDGQHRGAGQFRKKILERDDAVGEAAGLRIGFELGERDRMIEREFTDGGADNFGEMRARALELAEIVGQRANVSAGAAFHHEARERTFDACETKFVHFDFDRLELYGLILPGQLMGGAPVNFFGGEGGRNLLNSSNKLLRELREFIRIERGRGIGTERLAVRVIGVCGKTETDGAGVTFAAPGVEAGEARGAAESEDQNAGGEGIESAEMADLAETGQTSHRLDHIMRSAGARLIYDEDSIERRGLWSARHGRRGEQSELRALRVVFGIGDFAFRRRFGIRDFAEQVVNMLAVFLGLVRYENHFGSAA